MKRSIVALSLAICAGCDEGDNNVVQAPPPVIPPPVTCPPVEEREPFFESAENILEEGRQVFRFDTFGDEAFWGDQLRLHEAIAGSRYGGVGPGLSPANALALGLKVDVEALPDAVITQLKDGTIDLEDPGVTLTLLELNAVLGVTGFFEGTAEPMVQRRITSIGIQCAFCHSTVDDSLAPGIGARLDGWPNQDLDIGSIVALAPDLSPFTDLLGVDEIAVREVLHSWGPGKYDATLLLDGKAFRPDGRSAAVV